MKKRNMFAPELGVLLILAVLLSWATALERQQQELSSHMIRLHVVANSDSQRDQTIKLAVRDAVLERAEEALQGTNQAPEAKAVLLAAIPDLELAANQTLKAWGAEDRASISLRRELFGTRNYESFSLPGGYYDSLRVQIGAGEGHNWWCVVYPQICTAATSEERQSVAVMGGLSKEQIQLLEGEKPEYILKFRSIEILENLLGWFRGGQEGIPVSG